MDQQQIIVIALGAISAITGVIKSYFDYKLKMKSVSKQQKAPAQLNEKKEKGNGIDKILESLIENFKCDKIIILEITESKYSQKKLKVIYEIPKGELISKELDFEKFKKAFDIIENKGCLKIQKAYTHEDSNLKQLLLKHSFISCYAIELKASKIILMLYQKETILSEFDIEDIKKLFLNNS